MSLLRILPAEICLLLMAALGLRLGFPLILLLPLVVMLMLALLVPWAEVRFLMTGVLGFSTLLWGFMTVLRVAMRRADEQPFTRLALILGAVTLFNAWAAWLIWRSRKVLRVEQGDPRDRSGVPA